MGSRRVSRKRLFEVEKKGQAIDLESGLGIKDAIASATQHRQGQEIITEIVVDLGTTAADIVGGGSDKPVGVATQNAQITRLTKAKYGTITEVRVVCLEDGGADYDVVVGDEVEPTAATVNNRAELVTDIGNDLGEDSSALSSTIIAIDTNGMQTADNEWYLYVTNANGNSSTTSINSGKLIIYLHGFAAPADL